MTAACGRDGLRVGFRETRRFRNAAWEDKGIYGDGRARSIYHKSKGLAYEIFGFEGPLGVGWGTLGTNCFFLEP